MMEKMAKIKFRAPQAVEHKFNFSYCLKDQITMCHGFTSGYAVLFLLHTGDEVLQFIFFT